MSERKLCTAIIIIVGRPFLKANLKVQVPFLLKGNPVFAYTLVYRTLKVEIVSSGTSPLFALENLNFEGRI